MFIFTCVILFTTHFITYYLHLLHYHISSLHKSYIYTTFNCLQNKLHFTYYPISLHKFLSASFVLITTNFTFYFLSCQSAVFRKSKNYHHSRPFFVHFLSINFRLLRILPCCRHSLHFYRTFR